MLAVSSIENPELKIILMFLLVAGDGVLVFVLMRVMGESALSVFRAGADMLITYYAKELSDAIRKGDIG